MNKRQGLLFDSLSIRRRGFRTALIRAIFFLQGHPRRRGLGGNLRVPAPSMSTIDECRLLLVFVLQAPPAHVRVYPKALPAQSVELSAGLALALSGQLEEW